MQGNRKRDRPSLSDRDLVVAFKEGDGQAYDEIYIRHSPKVRVVCARRLGHPHDAEEALQETFLRAYQALPRFNGQYKLGAWLNRIAINVCIDHLRSRSKTEIVQAIEEMVLDAERGPEEIVGSSLPEVIEALSEIKPLHARALQLRAVHGLSHEELAGRLEMSPAQVKALLHRARLSFKRVLRGASGWVLAPFAALRRSHNEPHAISLGGGTINAMGFLAAVHASLPSVERIVTGTVLAALAVTSSAPDLTTPERNSFQRPAYAAVAHPSSARTGKVEAPTPTAKVVSTVQTAAVADKHLSLSHLSLGVPEVEAAVAEATETVKKKLREHKNKKNDDVSEPGPIGGDGVHGEIARKKSETQETAAEMTSGVLPDS